MVPNDRKDGTGCQYNQSAGICRGLEYNANAEGIIIIFCARKKIRTLYLDTWQENRFNSKKKI